VADLSRAPAPEAGVRLFVALPLPEALWATLAALQEDLRRQGVQGRWVAPESMHVTLAFLGELPPQAVPSLAARLQRLGRGHTAFDLTTTSLGAFPRLAQARVLWLGLAPEPRLVRLAAELREDLAAAGLAFDPKPFQAHLTLVRLQRPQRIPTRDSGPDPALLPVDRVVLYGSKLSGGGPRYTPLAEGRLRPSR